MYCECEGRETTHQTQGMQATIRNIKGKIHFLSVSVCSYLTVSLVIFQKDIEGHVALAPLLKVRSSYWILLD